MQTLKEKKNNIALMSNISKKAHFMKGRGSYGIVSKGNKPKINKLMLFQLKKNLHTK